MLGEGGSLDMDQTMSRLFMAQALEQNGDV